METRRRTSNGGGSANWPPKLERLIHLLLETERPKAGAGKRSMPLDGPYRGRISAKFSPHLKLLKKPESVVPLLLSSALLTTPGMPKNYLVRTVGEFNDAVRRVVPGDTVTLANGIWKDVALVFSATGSEGDSIALRAESSGQVFLTGASTLRIAGEYLVVDGLRFVGGYAQSGAVVEFRYGSRQARHCRLTNCSFVDYNPVRKTLDYKWVSLYGAYNRVDHCYFEGKENIGTTLVVWLSSQPNYHRIDHNYFARRPELGTNGGETIRVGTSDWATYDSFTLVEYNYFEHCNGESEIISSKSCGNTYRYNTFYECEGALTLRHGNRNLVEGNFFIGNRNPRAGGVRITGEDHLVINNYFCGLWGTDYRAALNLMNGIPNSRPEEYFQVKRALIAFNTFVDCRTSILLGFADDPRQTLSPEDCVFANNVVHTAYTVIRVDHEPVRTRWEGNIFFGAKLGIEGAEGILFADPQLQLMPDGLWRPCENSPVIDTAVGHYPLVSEDMDGQTRSEPKDIGADEVSTEPVIRRPLTPDDVGPDWMHSPHPIFLGVQAVGQGYVQLDPEGQVYEPGTLVRVRAIPSAGWHFSRWEGDLAGTDPATQILADRDGMIRAVFEKNSPTVYALRVFVFSSGGYVQLDPPGGSYPESTVVVLTAIANPGWRFLGWGGDLQSNENPALLLMDSDKTVMAQFEPVSAVMAGPLAPSVFAAGPSYPNPCNGSAFIPVSLPLGGAVELAILDLRGRAVFKKSWSWLPSGDHVLQVAAEELPSGSYVYRVKSGMSYATGSMVIVR